MCVTIWQFNSGQLETYLFSLFHHDDTQFIYRTHEQINQYFIKGSCHLSSLETAGATEQICTCWVVKCSWLSNKFVHKKNGPGAIFWQFSVKLLLTWLGWYSISMDFKCQMKWKSEAINLFKKFGLLPFIKRIVIDFDIFLQHESEDIQKKKLISKISV